jgi:aminobenzoyl-glutamate utilization protein B
VQTRDLQYRPFIRPDDQPAIDMNAGIMERYRPAMRAYYYDPAKFSTYLAQLGITYPTVRQADGSCPGRAGP